MNEQLHEKFTKHEVETARQILECSEQAPTTDMFRRLLMLFLRGHYSSKTNYPDTFSHLGCYQWSPDDKEKTLHIGYSYQEDDEKPDQHPGIYVGFGGTSLQKLVIGNLAGQSDDGSKDILTKGADLKLTVRHIAKEASNAVDLAEMSAQVLTAMAAPLALNSGATDFQVEGYGEPKDKNPSPKGYYAVALVVKISYNHSVTRSLESHRIRQITQELQSDN